jgi:hypothetical protein
MTMNSGELHPLDADRLDDHRSSAASETASEAAEASYGDERDTTAIENITARLAASPAGRSKSPEILREQAETLYAHICQQITGNQASQEQLTTMAALVGEAPASLIQRLRA